MPGFSQVFGGGNIYPVQPKYSQLSYAASIQLSWPIEQAIAGANVVTDIIDLNPAGPGLTVTLPDARQVSTGFTALFNNISGQTAVVNSNTGATLLSLVAGTVWQLYLIDNTTAGGTWRIFQFGASTSVAVAAALAGAGLTAIGSTLNENHVIQPKAANYTIVNTDRATVVQWTAGVGTFTLPAPGTVGAGWFVIVKNQGSGTLTISPTSGLIDGNASDSLSSGVSAWYITDGSNFFSLKGGGTAGGGGGAFNLLQIDVTGSGNYTLSGVQLNQIGYKFTGVLSGNRTIIVPNTAQEYWVDNETTGAFTLGVGTAAQVSPITVPQGNRYILYCDATNVLNANTSTVAFPITIAQGGTNATTAPVALTNLGGTTTGVTIFTAANVAAVISYLNVVTQTTQVIAGTWMTGGGALSGNVTLNVDQTKVAPLQMTPNIQNGVYQFAIADQGNTVYHNSGSTPTWTIPANATINFPLGAAITLVVKHGAGVVTLTPASVVNLFQAGTGAGGTAVNRFLNQDTMAVIIQLETDYWQISGVGVT